MKSSAALPDNPAALRYFLSLLSGALLALSFPKIGISPLAWVAFLPLFMAAAGATPKECFKLGFAAGVAAYAGLLYWLNVVLMRYGHLHWSVSGTLYLVAAGYLALYPAAVLWLTRRAEQRGLQTVLVFPVLWVAAELVRSYAATGFPWASLGYSQYRTLPLIQISDLTGVYGVSFLVAFANVVFYRMWVWTRDLEAPYPVRSFAALLVLLIVTLSYGFSRLNTPADGAPQRVLLVQGNIAQDAKWNPAYQESTLATYERLSRQACQSSGTLVVWPETALPFYLQGEARYAARVKSLAAELNSCLITGSPASEREQGTLHFLNSAFAISPAGEIVGRSDKLHLVPFGEYIPFGSLLPLRKLAAGPADYTPGKAMVPLDTPQGKVGVLICFEGIFPEVARGYVQRGAGLLVNITNDAWFGDTSAPYQHLSMTVFRAVENRVPLVRAANTGISSAIDSKGHIRGMTQLFQEATLGAEVRRGTGGSFYSRYGDVFASVCLAGTVLIAFASLRKWPGTSKLSFGRASGKVAPDPEHEE